MEIKEAIEEMASFVDKELNDGGKHLNAVAITGKCNEQKGELLFEEIIIRYKKDHSKLYAKAVTFAASLGGKIMETHPVTYETTIRFTAPFVR